MKKSMLLIIASAIIILSLQSCKSTQDCPAYGRTIDCEVEQQL